MRKATAAAEYVEFDPRMDGRWDVRWGRISLGHVDEQRLDRGLIVARRPRGPQKCQGCPCAACQG